MFEGGSHDVGIGLVSVHDLSQLVQCHYVLLPDNVPILELEIIVLSITCLCAPRPHSSVMLFMISYSGQNTLIGILQASPRFWQSFQNLHQISAADLCIC